MESIVLPPLTKKSDFDTLKGRVDALGAASPGTKYVYLERQNATTYRVWAKPTGGRWVRYTLNGTDTAGNYGAGPMPWRLSDVHVLDLSADRPDQGAVVSDALQIVLPGSAWEYAIGEAENNAANHGDIMVGNFHGLDKLLFMSWLVDSRPIADLAVGTWARGLSVTMQETSELYSRWRSVNSTPGGPWTISGSPVVLARPTREYVWTPEQVSFTGSREYLVSANMGTGYDAMSGVLRGAGITTKARYVADTVTQDVSVAGFAQRFFRGYGVILWNDTNPLTIRMDITPETVSEYQWGQPNMQFISNAAPYNKIYFMRYGTGVASRAVTAGTVDRSRWTWRAFWPTP